MGSGGDLALLIVLSDGIHRRKTSVEINGALRGIGVPKDVVVVTEQDVMAYRYNPSMVLKPALDEGKVLDASV